MFKLSGRHRSVGNYTVEYDIRYKDIMFLSELFVFRGDIAGLLRTSLYLSNPMLQNPKTTILTVNVDPESVRSFSMDEQFLEKHPFECAQIYELAGIVHGVASLTMAEGVPLQNSLEIQRLRDWTPVFTAVSGTEIFSCILPNAKEVKYNENVNSDYFTGTNPLTPAILEDFQNRQECQDKGFKLLDAYTSNGLSESEYCDEIVEYHYLSEQLKEIFDLCQHQIEPTP